MCLWGISYKVYIRAHINLYVRDCVYLYVYRHTQTHARTHALTNTQTYQYNAENTGRTQTYVYTKINLYLHLNNYVNPRLTCAEKHQFYLMRANPADFLFVTNISFNMQTILKGHLQYYLPYPEVSIYHLVEGYILQVHILSCNCRSSCSNTSCPSS